MNDNKVRCGDCRYFIRDGKCDFLTSEAGKAKDRPFAHAPFWVWSDCYSDREQVRSDVATLCPTFEGRLTTAEPAYPPSSARRTRAYPGYHRARRKD